MLSQMTVIPGLPRHCRAYLGQPVEQNVVPWERSASTGDVRQALHSHHQPVCCAPGISAQGWGGAASPDAADEPLALGRLVPGTGNNRMYLLQDWGRWGRCRPA